MSFALFKQLTIEVIHINMLSKPTDVQEIAQSV